MLGRITRSKTNLYRWYQDELPEIIKIHSGKLDKKSFVKLVEWKVGIRGKWRPRLLDFAKAATEGAIGDAFLLSFNTLSKIKHDRDVSTVVLKEALTPLTELKGVGPATGTAALAAMHPSVPFMSDEALLAALGSKEYTVKYAVQLMEALQKKARELNVQSTGGSGKHWTAKMVEQCLFAAAKEGAVSLSKGKSTLAGGSKKRKR